MGKRLRWVGGDATPEVAGALDWKAKHYMREDARVMLRALGQVPELAEEPDMKIALAELLCFVGLAARALHGKGRSSPMPRTTRMSGRG